jgi:sugar phosphate isomerase/epimerase
MFWQLPIDQVCQRVAKLGIQGLDIWSAFGHCTHLEEANSRFGPASTKKMLADTGLELSAITVYWTGYPPFAETLGRMGGGIVVRGSTENSPGSLTAKMMAFLESLKPELELAEKHNAKLAIENHSGPTLLLNKLDTIKAFVDLNRSPRAGIALAAAHIQVNKESVEEAIRICGSQLLFFYAWQFGKGIEQLPGHGPTDCAPWIEALARVGYRGFVNVFMHGEIEPAEMEAAVAKSVAYLKNCYAKVEMPV